MRDWFAGLAHVDSEHATDRPKCGATGATGATERQKPQNSAIPAVAPGSDGRCNSGATGATSLDIVPAAKRCVAPVAPGQNPKVQQNDGEKSPENQRSQGGVAPVAPVAPDFGRGVGISLSGILADRPERELTTARCVVADFLDQHMAAARRIGWTEPELFGCHPNPKVARIRFDYMGAVTLAAVSGQVIERITERAAHYAGGLVYYRRDMPEGVVVTSDFAESRIRSI